jgi:cytochrome P450
MMMALHPDVQIKCQNELDEVLGEKPPTMDDMNSLNYIMATINEIMRFSMVAESSLPHRLTKDMEIDEYKFKKDTMFFSNLAKFLNDPVQFP